MHPAYGDTKPAILIKNALDHITEPGSVFEIRIPKARSGTVSGYFDDTAIAASLIARENGKHPAIYVTVNPVNPALLARNHNVFERGSFTTTSDSEILKRRWFLVDLDPKRPVGISSTDGELDAAVNRAESIKDWLSSIGWPEPLEAISGNGAHLMYRVDEPNDDDTRTLFEYATKMLASIFSDDVVDVDTTVWNSSRIWKVYGTIAAKGSDSPDRPHRVGALTRIPKDIQLVPRGLLENVARALLESKSDEFKDMTGEYIADMEKWLFERGVKLTSGARPMYGNEGKKWSLARCPFNEHHTTAMVGLVSNRPVFRCLHNSCSAFRWKDFREKIDPNFKDPDTIRVRLQEWADGSSDELDKELLESASRTGKKLDSILKGLKKDVPRARFLVLEDALKAERRRFVKETIGDNNDKGNIVGLINRTKAMQAEGIVPPYWTADYDGRIRVGEIGDIKAAKLSTTDEIELLIKFHSLGDSWVKQMHCGQVIQHIAHEYTVNPIRKYLKSYTWDGVERLTNWLPHYMGTLDNEYTQAIGRKWLISAVARGMEPGCQADHMLIFEGKQGIGKSQALRILGGDYYTEFSRTLGGAGSKHADVVAVMSGKLILEMSELATLKKADMESLRSFLTTTVDDARLAYERDSRSYPRTCVTAGTTNDVGQAYIADKTGARRFWPTHAGEAGALKIDLLRQDRDQLWAEAVEAYDNGEDWYKVPGEIVAAEQEKRQITVEDSDPWYGVIRLALTNPDHYSNGVFHIQDLYEKGQKISGDFVVRIGTLSGLLGIVLGIDTDRQSQYDVIRLREILKSLQFIRSRPSRGWIDSTYAYDLSRDRMPHLWPAIQAARKQSKSGEFRGVGAEATESGDDE